jgi:AraC-like DNA-binding protein
VSFNKQENRFYFSLEQLELPVLSHDKSLYSLFGKLLEEKENTMQVQYDSFAETVTKVVMRDFKGQIPSLEVVAFHMNLSPRSFQRKLQAEGVTYRVVTAELKKELATNLLKNSDYKVNTIAEVLGYTEPSAFRKAFKSWTNATPVQLKRTP